MSTRTSLLVAAVAGALLCQPAFATAKKPKHPVAAAKEAKSTEPKADPNNPDAAEPDVKDTTVVEYSCELGNKVTLYKNEGDDAHIAIKWKQRLHRLTRVGTTTGALRFENPYWGLIWIGIPAKGILLDSKHNHQLANECKTPEQAKTATPAARQG
ncbi:MAG: hypothetical protein ACXU8N_15290 [Telluria sp.]